MSNTNRSINAKDNSTCTGCGICAISCPSSCIAMVINQDGYFVADTDISKCTNCGRCQKVCYKFIIKNNLPYSKEISVYAATNNDMQVRKASSSGGIGPAIAELAIDLGYKVVGAALNLDANIVEHIIIDKKEEIHKIIGSKYLPSYTYKAFSELNSNHKILIIGTPCQIGGLRRLLNLNNSKGDIILVDFRCFGKCGYNLFDKYVSYLSTINSSGIVHINMRDKTNGWFNWGIKTVFRDGNYHYKNKINDLFAIAFRSGQAIHDVCLKCDEYKNNSHADIRIEDGWHVMDKCTQDDLKSGISMVTIYSTRGSDLVELLEKKVTFKKVNVDIKGRSWTRIIKNDFLMETLRNKDLDLPTIIKLFRKSWTFKQKSNWFFGQIILFLTVHKLRVVIDILSFIKKTINQLRKKGFKT